MWDEVFWNLFCVCIDALSNLHVIVEAVEKGHPVVSTDTLRVLEDCESQVIESHLFQRDEYLEDITTGSLKYLLVPFLRAKYLETHNDIQNRHAALLTAKLHFSIFVHETSWYGREKREFLEAQREFETFVTTDHYKGETRKKDSAPLSAETRRAAVIGRQTRVKHCIERMMNDVSEARKGIDSPESREFWESLLLCAIYESITSCDLINQELPLIARRLNEDGGGPCTKSSELTLDGQGQVLTKPFIMRINNSAEMRKFFGSKIFGPGHVLPSISLAEAADHDLNVEVRNLQAAQKRTVDRVVDDEDRERKARSFDDWKDENPKGSGNTMVNRG
eukprot:Protomagalhaensia_sp_Gyna_25__4638@NODE_430_length_3466_cov_76_185293_g331_i0_p1_GENE_NODE_430_length_3466_cov_76_185293_g331_i0NODE_430_length_3466_cov_76_185293_g331_i0_p1_ORF_typecomplete_len335_score72_89TAP42/PF04177_12/1_2e40_NODE_430_length_3466_cov_76_185293_g331_i01641168